MIHSCTLGSMVALVGLTGCGFLSVDTSCHARHTCPLDDAGDDAAASADASRDEIMATDTGPTDAMSDDERLPEAGAGVDAALFDAHADVVNGADASDAAGPMALANLALTGPLLVDSSGLYGVSGGHAVALSVQTGATLATSAASSGSLWTMSTTSLFATARAGNPVYSFDKTTLSASSILDNGGFGDWPLGAASGSVLWVWSQGQGSPLASLTPYALAGGSPTGNTMNGAGTCMLVAGDGLGVVYSLASYDDTTGTAGRCLLFAMSPAGADNVPLASPAGATPTVLAIGQAAAYWFNSADGKLYTSDRSGNGFTALVSSALADAPVELAVDSARVFWTDGRLGTVSAVPIDAVGASPTMIASGQPGAAGVAVDASAIYWATASAVMKLAK